MHDFLIILIFIIILLIVCFFEEKIKKKNAKKCLYDCSKCKNWDCYSKRCGKNGVIK